MKKVHETREKLAERRNKRKRDIQLAIDFSKQHLSVSKALQRHEFMIWKEACLRKNSEFVESKKSELIEQRELVKTYLEKRNVLRTAQAVKEKRWLEARLKDDSASANQATHNRVDNLKLMREESRKKSTIKPNSAATILFYNFSP